MAIQWEKCEPAGYENMVSVLLSRIHPNARRIDGKGGDGGRDVQIVSGQDAEIINAFELKSFTGRMTPGRRNQVERSLERAVALRPSQWTLVVPIDPTPGEDNWFRGLGKKYRVPTDWLGKTWLDEKMSAFPDIRRYFLEGAKDEVYRLLKDLREEQARITDVHDAVGRARTLHESLNEIDPHYRYELSTGTTAATTWPSGVVFSVSFTDVRIDVYPKYLGAVKDRPITVTVTVVGGPNGEVVQNALDYGLEATIQAPLISSVTIDAPLGLGGDFNATEINLSPINTKLEEPVTLALKVMDGDRVLANCPVHFTEHTGGLRGSVTTGTDSTGWLQIRLKHDNVAEEMGVKFWLTPKPAMPAGLVPLFRWLRACRPPHDFVISFPGGPEIRDAIQTSHLIDDDLGRVVEDLAFLQNHSGIYWEMPSSLTVEEGQAIVTAATLLRGEIIPLTWSSFNMSLDQWSPKLEELVGGRPQAFMWEQDGWLELEGVNIPIGRIRTYFESIRLADPESILRALKSGSVLDLRLVPGDSNKGQRSVVSQLTQTPSSDAFAFHDLPPQ